jgi:hypothetical protein
MKPKVRALAVIAIAALALPFALAQNGGGAAAVRLMMMGDDAGIVLGQPCHAVELLQTTRTLPDGTTITHRSEEMKWRDSLGRFRKESAPVEQNGDPDFRAATIVDPVNNTLIVLNMERKVATVFHLSDHGAASLHKYTDPLDDPLFARPGVQVKVEKLPGKYIDGVYAVGRRVTRVRPPGTIGNDKTVVSVSERWVSPDLKILVASTDVDPRVEISRALTQVDRGEPDPSLFAVPSGFTVRDVPVHSQNQ